MNWDETRALIDGYAGIDPTEESSRRSLLELFDSFEDPWNRDRYDPGHLTASAFVVHPDRSAIALIHHEKLGMWVQPGGHVEVTDRSHEEAARREVAEECLLTELDTLGVVDLDVHVFPQRGDQPRHLHFDLRWAFVAATSTVGAGDGALDVRWVALDEARTLDESIARTARKLESDPWRSRGVTPANE